MKQIQEVQMWRYLRGPAGAVMRETRDVGIKWPQCHTLIFEGEVRIDRRYVCPKDVGTGSGCAAEEDEGRMD